MKEQFSFTTEFQLEVLRYIVRDPEGGLALSQIKPSYLTLIEHSIVAEGLSKFFKKHNRVPGKPVLKEIMKDITQSKNYAQLIIKEDLLTIDKVIDNIYNPHVLLKDSDIIQEEIYKFTAFVEMKNLNESFDLQNFNQYQEYVNKATSIIQKSAPRKKDELAFLVTDVKTRQFKRQANPDVTPTPFKQLNDATNGGGYSKGSIIVLLDKAKARKTFTLVNAARSYLSMKKNVLYIDTENGKHQIMGRMVQSSLNKTMMEMNTGDYDDLEQKHVRKLKRLGVEFAVERINAMIDDTNTIKSKIQEFKDKTGKKVDILIVDYAAKMASINKDKDDNDRLFNVYVDLQNLALAEDIEHVWTANHVTREAAKHKTTKYEEGDIASAISIVRNAVAIWGLNSTEEEEENGIQRFELVVQREGKPHARALFNINPDCQRMVEFTKEQRKLYDDQYGSKLDEKFKKHKAVESKGKTTGNGDI